MFIYPFDRMIPFKNFKTVSSGAFDAFWVASVWSVLTITDSQEELPSGQQADNEVSLISLRYKIRWQPFSC